MSLWTERAEGLMASGKKKKNEKEPPKRKRQLPVVYTFRFRKAASSLARRLHFLGASSFLLPTSNGGNNAYTPFSHRQKSDAFCICPLISLSSGRVPLLSGRKLHTSSLWLWLCLPGGSQFGTPTTHLTTSTKRNSITYTSLNINSVKNHAKETRRQYT